LKVVKLKGSFDGEIKAPPSAGVHVVVLFHVFATAQKTCLLAQMPNNLINSMVIAPSLIPLTQNCAPLR
jgi:hypothetical protein